jgi:diguanylate cyclase (GGDEF)-like protein
MNVKNKTLLFAVTVIIVFSGVLFLAIFDNQLKKLKAQENQYYEMIKDSENKVVEKFKEFYKNRIFANINSKGVKEAISKKDRNTLYELSKGRWEVLKKENKYLRVMHFHSPDGTSFLRMHEPAKNGDIIANFRPMVREIHQKKQPLYGFEAGIFNLAYRVFHPIFSNGQYIGALEFGVRPDYFLNEMMYYNNLKGALFVKNEELNLYKEEKSILLDNYVLQYDTLDDMELLNNLVSINYTFQNKFKMQFDNKTYRVYSFPVLDYTGAITAREIFFHDISDFISVYKSTLLRMVVTLLLLLVVLIIVINYGFKIILNKLDVAYNELEKVSITDKLTSVFNRVKLDSVIIDEHKRYERNGNEYSLILFDIDHFKSVNDTYGHIIGDMVLQQLASLVSNTIRTTDILGRWGGEEFLVICPTTSKDGATSLAEKIRMSVEKHKFTEVGTVTASFGVGTIKENLNSDDLLKLVDESLYKAKEEGRNKVVSL